MARSTTASRDEPRTHSSSFSAYNRSKSPRRALSGSPICRTIKALIGHFQAGVRNQQPVPPVPLPTRWTCISTILIVEKISQNHSLGDVLVHYIFLHIVMCFVYLSLVDLAWA